MISLQKNRIKYGYLAVSRTIADIKPSEKRQAVSPGAFDMAALAFSLSRLDTFITPDILSA